MTLTCQQTHANRVSCFYPYCEQSELSSSCGNEAYLNIRGPARVVVPSRNPKTLSTSFKSFDDNPYCSANFLHVSCTSGFLAHSVKVNFRRVTPFSPYPLYLRFSFLGEGRSPMEVHVIAIQSEASEDATASCL